MKRFAVRAIGAGALAAYAVPESTPTSRRKLLAAATVVGLVGCASSPPPSQFPDAESLLNRMHETYACSRGISGEAKVEYFQGGTRVRGDVLYVAMLPNQVRFDAFSPFGVMLSSMTSDGERFSLFDLREKVFFQGRASACNLARFTGASIPPHALVQLLRGEAPVLVHEPGSPTLSWNGGIFSAGEYEVVVPSRHGATEHILAVPDPSDWNKPWAAQRIWVNSVAVEQQGYPLYEATLADHYQARMAVPAKDPDGLGPDVPPSGPACNAPVPRRIRLQVPHGDKDLVLHVGNVDHNPPLPAGRFEQPIPGGVRIQKAVCSE